MSGNLHGAVKTAALRAGLSMAEYVTLRTRGMKRCTTCREWLSAEAFVSDGSRGDGLSARCVECSRALYRAKYVKRGPNPHRRGRRLAPPRDGDREQARGRANTLVRKGAIPDPNDVPCTDCGHTYDGVTRHEYDHHKGYAAEHHEAVESVCSPCHHARERARRSAS